jgi:hypothetical protein
MSQLTKLELIKFYTTLIKMTLTDVEPKMDISGHFSRCTPQITSETIPQLTSGPVLRVF